MSKRADVFWPLVCVFLFIAVQSYAQEADNVSFARTSDKDGKESISFTYNLISSFDNFPCFVRVKYTTESKTFYLQQVTGDVGNLVYPGVKKLIIWDFKEELIHNTSAESVTINIEAFPNLSAEKKVKRGKNLIVNLDEIYEKGKFYNVKLYRKGVEVRTLVDSLELQHHFVTLIPSKAKVGKDYQIAISTGGKKAMYTNPFRIKPRVATFWKILPLLAVPAFIFTRQQVKENKDLPGAPASPTN